MPALWAGTGQSAPYGADAFVLAGLKARSPRPRSGAPGAAPSVRSASARQAPSGPAFPTPPERADSPGSLAATRPPAGSGASGAAASAVEYVGRCGAHAEARARTPSCTRRGLKAACRPAAWSPMKCGQRSGSGACATAASMRGAVCSARGADN